MFVCFLHFVAPLFLCFARLIWCFIFLCDEKPFIKWLSCLPVALMGVSCAHRKRGCDCEAFNGNKQKTNWRTLSPGCIWYAEIHMFCINLFVCSSAWVGNGLSMGLAGGVGWWTGLEGLEQLQLIFKMYLLTTTRKCLVELDLILEYPTFKNPTASEFLH